MTLYSSGLFFVLTASGCIDNALTLPVSPSLQDEKTLAFGTTIHFVRDSKSNRGRIFELLPDYLLINPIPSAAACNSHL